MSFFHKIIIGLCWICIVTSCTDDPAMENNETSNSLSTPLFSLVDNSQTGIDFSNTVEENQQKNYFNFEYIYNGGGVATGDINNDGLVDIFFVGNEVPSKLYLNKGDFKFQDISKNAKVAGKGGWSNGVAMVDINHDGWLDIYVCRGGYFKDGNQRKNLLYINQGKSNKLMFEEMAEAYGIAEAGYSIQSSFFDYDNDGDLDVYVTNHPIAFGTSNFQERLALRKNPKDEFRDKLYRNDGVGSEGHPTFTEVSKSAGIFNYGHGLGIATADFNKDGWTDIYITNDYNEPDYMYMNNGNGTFTDKVKEVTRHVSFYAMGVDAGDINNDGWEDIVTTEMLPKDYKRSKTNMASMNVPLFNALVDNGLQYQYMHNALQLNMGKGQFSDISQLAGIAKTDWSWTCLLSDFDNDGLKDLFVANGYKRDVFDKDYKKKADAIAAKNNNQLSLDQLYSVMPATKLQNFIYQNNGDLTFQDKSTAWGLREETLTQGVAIADFDNDGDLDLVMNNLDEPALIYQNNANQSGNNYIRIKLKGAAQNTNGLGAKVTIHYDGKIQFRDFRMVRGFLSSSEPIAHFGIGKIQKLDKVEVQWYNGKTTILENVNANQVLLVDASAAKPSPPKNNKPTIFKEKTNVLKPVFTHKENEFDDYKVQILLPHKQSQNGPFISTGDVNGDGLEDFFIGGAHLQAGSIYLQNNDGTFTAGSNEAFQKDYGYEDMGSTLFDSDGDGDLDLYVVSGGFEFEENTPPLQDRLYLNDGKGNFYNQSQQTLFPKGLSGSCVVATDYDNDGDQDLFVGSRVIPNRYPFAPESMLLENNGGKFQNVIQTVAPELQKVGMVTTAVWEDIDGDGFKDLMVAGEWMPLKIFLNKNGKFTDATDQYNLSETMGWWNKIIATDIDGDGDTDFVAGNLGLNHKFQAKAEEPFHVYCSDFDSNGSYDVVLAKNYDGQQVPIRGRECSSEQMPFVAEKFPTFESFADADIGDILGDEKNNALHYEAKIFETIFLENEGGSFKIKPLPLRAQFSPTNGIVAHDFNGDGKKDLMLAGNMFHTEVETTRADASVGLLLENNGKNFQPVSMEKSGLFLPYDIKDIKAIKTINGMMILVATNDGPLRVLSTE